MQWEVLLHLDKDGDSRTPTGQKLSLHADG